MLQRLIPCLLASLCCITALASSLTDNRTQLRRLLWKSHYSPQEVELVSQLSLQDSLLLLPASEMRRGQTLSTQACFDLALSLEQACRRDDHTDNDDYRFALAACMTVCFDSYDDRAFTFRQRLIDNINQLSDSTYRQQWLLYTNLTYPDALVPSGSYSQNAVNTTTYALLAAEYFRTHDFDSDLTYELALHFIRLAWQNSLDYDFLPRLYNQLRNYNAKTFGEQPPPYLVADEMFFRLKNGYKPAEIMNELQSLRSQFKSNHLAYFYLLWVTQRAYVGLKEYNTALELIALARTETEALLPHNHTTTADHDLNKFELIKFKTLLDLAEAAVYYHTGEDEKFGNILSTLIDTYIRTTDTHLIHYYRSAIFDAIVGMSGHKLFDSKFKDDFIYLLTNNWDDSPASVTLSPYYILSKHNTYILKFFQGQIADDVALKSLLEAFDCDIVCTLLTASDLGAKTPILDTDLLSAEVRLACIDGMLRFDERQRALALAHEVEEYFKTSKHPLHMLSLYSLMFKASESMDPAGMSQAVNAYDAVRQQIGLPILTFSTDWIIEAAKAKSSSTPEQYMATLKRMLKQAQKSKQHPDLIALLCYQIFSAYDQSGVLKPDQMAELRQYCELGLQAAVASGNGNTISGMGQTYLLFLQHTGDFKAFNALFNTICENFEKSNLQTSVAYINFMALILRLTAESGNMELANRIMAKLFDAKDRIERADFDLPTKFRLLSTVYSELTYTFSKWINRGIDPKNAPIATMKDFFKQYESTIGDKDPMYFRLCYTTAHLHASLGEFNEAEALADRLCNLYPDSIQQPKDVPFDLRLQIAIGRKDIPEMMRLLTSQQPFLEDMLASGNNLINMQGAYFQLESLMMYSGRYDDMLKLATKRFDMMKKFIENEYASLGEDVKMALMQSGAASANDIYVILPKLDSDDARRLAYNASITYRNLMLESANAYRSAVYRTNNSLTIAKYELAQSLRKQIAGLDNRTPDVTRQFSALQDSVQRLNSELAQRCPAVNSLRLRQRTDWNNVERALNKKDAAIEFIVMPDYIMRRWQYGALILRKKDKSPVFVPLASEAELNELLSLATKAVKQETGVNRTYRYNMSGRELYGKLWAPLEPYLEGIENVYFAPTGQLSYIAFAAIEDSTGTPLCQRYRLHQLSSTAQVCQLNGNDMRKGTNVPTYGLIGGIHYDADPAKAKDRLRNWAYLPESRTEIDFIDSLYRANFNIAPKRLHQLEATEAEVRAMSGNSPRILQLCTHGFYSNAVQASRQPFFINKGLTNDSVPNTSIQPLKRGGIILADANTVWNNEGQRDDETDGVLTSEELSTLDLSNTELAVLSACETGLGEYSSTEGINGLQRGLKLAGVKSIIMTLWRVNDHASSEFMQRLHSHIIVDRQQPRLAFHNTQREMQSKYPNRPYLWAPFILLD